jgi:hypothetical protein
MAGWRIPSGRQASLIPGPPPCQARSRHGRPPPRPGPNYTRQDPAASSGAGSTAGQTTSQQGREPPSPTTKPAPRSRPASSRSTPAAPRPSRQASIAQQSSGRRSPTLYATSPVPAPLTHQPPHLPGQSSGELLLRQFAHGDLTSGHDRSAPFAGHHPHRSDRRHHHHRGRRPAADPLLPAVPPHAGPPPPRPAGIGPGRRRPAVDKPPATTLASAAPTGVSRSSSRVVIAAPHRDPARSCNTTFAEAGQALAEDIRCATLRAAAQTMVAVALLACAIGASRGSCRRRSGRRRR